MPENPGHDFLREMMKATLKKGAVTMKFLIQPKTSDNQSVEDCMNEWKEEEAPFYEVATIHIPSQDFDTPELNMLGETLSFNPWHALPDHRPRISRIRNEMNSVERREP